MKNLLFAQLLVLLGGTAFAWYQWYMEYFQHCEPCSGEEAQFFSKCFLGAVFFTIALILNILVLVFSKNDKE